MGDLKTTQDRRERFVAWLHMPGEDRYSIRAWCVAEDACDDVEVLLRENAKLRAVAEAARELVSESRRGGCSCTQRWRSEESTASSCACCDAERDVSTALAALEAP